ncbi:MAG TPA: hypothetical protein VN814_24920 [Caulobacteraceae bacterium]|nr:hypothetical protein [Caulobacteraceae bacterium]
MTRFSSVDAALEGLRVIKREPMAVLYWIAVWAFALAMIAIVRLATGSPTAAHSTDSVGLIHRYGPLAIVLAPTVLALWIMTTATVYRAVLRPGEHGWHLFKLGPDEARIAVLSALETVIFAALGGVPAYLLLVLLNPIFEALPSLNRLIAFVGFVLTILIDGWIAVRLSLAPAQTFSERGFPFGGYWGFARGRSWRLLLSYVIVGIEVLVFLLASLVVGLVFGALTEATIQWRDPTLLRRVVLWVLVAILAILTAIVWVIPLTLICGCQAYAYRAIAAARTPSAA